MTMPVPGIVERVFFKLHVRIMLGIVRVMLEKLDKV